MHNPVLRFPGVFGSFPIHLWPVRVGFPALDLGRDRIHKVVEHGHHQATLLVQHATHFGIDLFALDLINLGAGLKQHRVEFGPFPARVVPVRCRQIGRGVHLVLHRTTTPVGAAEGLHVPHFRPVAVIGFTLDFQWDTGGLGRLLEEGGGIDRAGEGPISGPQDDGRAVMAGLFVVLGRFFQIEFALRDRVVKQRIGRVDRHVVPDGAVALQDFLDHFLAVKGVFQGQTQLFVVEGGSVDMGDKHIVAPACRRQHVDGRCAVQELGDLGLNPVDCVHLARLQGGRPGRGVVQNDQFNGVIVGHNGLVAAPVIVAALEHHTHARFVSFQRVGAGADGIRHTVKAAVGLDDQVVVGHQVGQVSVADTQRDFERVAVGPHALDALHDAQGTGLGLFVGVARHRLHDVFGGDGLTVGEHHACADFEAPDRGVGRAFPAFGDEAVQGAVGVQFNEGLAPAEAARKRHVRGPCGGVLAVGAFAALDAHSEGAARNGCCVAVCTGCICQDGGRDSGGDAECGGAAHEFAACERSGRHF
mmetsp:Transcript_18179/g.28464  ORF Transcript_18179/g.28464 Transcript_18179/m.28464 type:complete len:531 (+) Transcript_18179:13802-15394(+)